MNLFLFAFIFLFQAFDVVPILGTLNVPPSTRDGVGADARFSGIGAMWNVGPDLYIAEGPTIRKLNLQTREVSTVTLRAGTGLIQPSNNTSTRFRHLADLWSDGTFLYATDIGASRLRRILLSTGEVSDLGPASSVPWGLTGEGNNFFVGNANTREIFRIDGSTHQSQLFVQLSPPIDPSTCNLGSGCIGYYIPSPRDLWSDGKYIYATGLNTSIRRVEIATGAESNLPALPFVPRTITGDQTYVYINFGEEIGRQNLATGAYQTIVRGSFSGGLVGYNNDIYTGSGNAIIRIDIATGNITHVAGIDSSYAVNAQWREGENFYGYGDHSILRINATTGEVSTFAGQYRNRFVFMDGVGTDAEFANLQGMWGDGSNLYVSDAHGIRRVNLATAEVTTLTGGPVGDAQVGPASTARLGLPSALWGVGDYLYVVDGALCLIYKIDARNGEVSHFAGSPVKMFGIQPGEGCGYVDGPGALARFRAIHGIWSDGTLLYLTDSDKIRTVSIATAEVRTLTTIPGSFLRHIWGDSENLYVTGYPGMWRVSRQSGEAEPVVDGTSGLILQPNAGVMFGYGGTLFVSGNGAISRLDPRPLPTSVNFRLNPAASTLWATIGAGPSSPGYGLIDRGAEGTLGMAIYTNRQNGAVISETSVPMSSLVSEGRIYASVQGPVNTGLALANPGDTAVVISFYSTDINGNDFGAGTFTLPAHQQIAKFLNEAPFTNTNAGPVFGTSSIQGTFTFKSSSPIGAVALRGLTNERSEFLMTTLPIAQLSAGPNSPAILPQYAAGGGWTTEIILVNPTSVPISGTLDFQSRIPYTIPPRTSRVFTSAGGSSITTGAVTVIPSTGGAPTTVGIFSFKNSSVTVTSAGVPEVKTSRAFEVLDELLGNFRFAQVGSMGTGIAIANPSNSEITIHVEQYALEGVPTGRLGVFTVPARGHVAMFTHEIPHVSLNPDTFIGGGGRIRLWTDSNLGFSVVGLRARYNERGEFLITSTPALADDAPLSSSPAILPHFVQGGGYTTEFVLLNRTIGAVANGAVRYFSQSGQPVSIPVQ